MHWKSLYLQEVRIRPVEAESHSLETEVAGNPLRCCWNSKVLRFSSGCKGWIGVENRQHRHVGYPQATLGWGSCLEIWVRTSQGVSSTGKMKVCKAKVFLSASSDMHIGDSGSKTVVERTTCSLEGLVEGSGTAISDREAIGLPAGGWRGNRRSGCGQSRGAEGAKGNGAGTPAKTKSCAFSYFHERNPSRGR